MCGYLLVEVVVRASSFYFWVAGGVSVCGGGRGGGGPPPQHTHLSLINIGRGRRKERCKLRGSRNH